MMNPARDTLTLGYSTTLRSLTQGRATYTMEVKHYAAVPKHILDQIAVSGKRH